MRKWLFLIPLVIVLGLGTWLARELYTPYRGYQGHLVLVIPPGARAPRVANLLLQSGILNHRFPFLFRYWVGRWHQRRSNSVSTFLTAPSVPRRFIGNWFEAKFICMPSSFLKDQIALTWLESFSVRLD